MFEKYIDLFACRVCRAEKEASGRPCPASIGQYCPYIEKAKLITKETLEKDIILVKRGEIA